eukprot:TRINITY_DN10433_c0_g1_i2.p1 TRINITY_DN10433_c0_g1~~TRINITY_DN10433_c0_g1_i2.p1  ORF type:complete len:680 (+),score=136.25 TRINITY_DN10433_c0_g1_i2:98-2041(+)
MAATDEAREAFENAHPGSWALFEAYLHSEGADLDVIYSREILSQVIEDFFSKDAIPYPKPSVLKKARCNKTLWAILRNRGTASEEPAAPSHPTEAPAAVPVRVGEAELADLWGQMASLLERWGIFWERCALKKGEQLKKIVDAVQQELGWGAAQRTAIEAELSRRSAELRFVDVQCPVCGYAQLRTDGGIVNCYKCSGKFIADGADSSPPVVQQPPAPARAVPLATAPPPPTPEPAPPMATRSVQQTVPGERLVTIHKTPQGKVGMRLLRTSVLMVAPGGPAEQAGIVKDCRLVRVDGQVIDGSNVQGRIAAAPQVFTVSAVWPAPEAPPPFATPAAMARAAPVRGGGAMPQSIPRAARAEVAEEEAPRVDPRDLHREAPRSPGAGPAMSNGAARGRGRGRGDMGPRPPDGPGSGRGLPFSAFGSGPGRGEKRDRSPTRSAGSDGGAPPPAKRPRPEDDRREPGGRGRGAGGRDPRGERRPSPDIDGRRGMPGGPRPPGRRPSPPPYPPPPPGRPPPKGRRPPPPREPPPDVGPRPPSTAPPRGPSPAAGKAEEQQGSRPPTPPPHQGELPPPLPQGPLTRRKASTLLGIDVAASQAEINAAYRALAMKWHPDRHGGSAEATAFFQGLATSKDLLLRTKPRPAAPSG